MRSSSSARRETASRVAPARRGRGRPLPAAMPRTRRASCAKRWRSCCRPSTTRSPATWRRGWCTATAAPTPRPDAPVSGRPDGSAPPPSADVVTAAARSALGPGEAGWLVGGCLRDELLGLPVRDVDIVVDGAAEPFSRSLADRLGGAVFTSSDAFGTWRLVLGDLHVDVAPLRGEAGTPVTAAPDPVTRGARLEADLRGRERRTPPRRALGGAGHRRCGRGLP